MTAPIRPGTARRLGLDQPEPPRRDLQAEAMAEIGRQMSAAFARLLTPTDEEKARMFRRATGIDQ